MSFNIEVQGGTSVRLPTQGKYCDRDIVVTAVGGGIDTSDATATANDMAYGATAYANGQKITGSLQVHEFFEVNELSNDAYFDVSNGRLFIEDRDAAGGRAIVEKGFMLEMDATPLGNAEASDVVEDKTFTSKNGLSVQGTLPIARGGVSQEVTPEDVGYMPYVRMKHTFTERKVIDPDQGGDINLQAPYEAFGDATAGDVAKGKTFTSVDGFKVVGTLISGGGLPSGFSALATDTVTFASGSYAPTITHGLGVAPNFFCVFVEGDITISNNSGYMVGYISRKQPFEGNAGYYTTISITSAGINSMSGNVIKEADVDNYFGAETFIPYGFFKGGLTYRWICGVVD